MLVPELVKWVGLFVVAAACCVFLSPYAEGNGTRDAVRTTLIYKELWNWMRAEFVVWGTRRVLRDADGGKQAGRGFAS